MVEEKTTIPTGYKGATFDLQKILDKFGITGTGLAEMMGVSQPSVAIWMKRGTVSLSTAFRIATVLKCDIRTRVRDKKRLEKVGNLVKNSYLYR